MNASFYVIIKKASSFTFRPYHNWIADAVERYVGIRFIILGIDVEISKYDRSKHLKLIINEYRAANKNRDGYFLSSPGVVCREKETVHEDLEKRDP